MGISPADTAITTAYTLVGGSKVDDAGDFTDSVHSTWHAAMTIRADATVITDVHNMGGQTFTPGTYRSDTINVVASTTVILDGQDDPNSVFLFQAVSTMLTGANCEISLINGAKAENVLWALGTALTTGANNIFKGSILAGSAITIGAGSSTALTTVGGDVVAKTAITFGANVAVHGCVVALSEITFGAEDSVSV